MCWLLELWRCDVTCRAHRAPRTSYRVGVMHPSDGTSAAGNTQSLVGLGALLGQGAACPAVMTASRNLKVLVLM
jgi:hypothetical protein